MTGRKIPTMVPLLIAAVLLAGSVTMVLQMRPAEGQPSPLSPLGIEVIGQREWLTGSTAALRVVVADHGEGEPVRGARVRIAISPAGGGAGEVLWTGRTDVRGTTSASFQIPELAPARSPPQAEFDF